MTNTPYDVLFVGDYWTAGLDAPVSGAIAIRDGLIVAIEHDEQTIGRLQADAKRVSEIGEGLLIPGFQDAHVHPVMARIRAAECALHEIDTADAVLDEIARYAHAHPDKEWITGGGWSFASFTNEGPRRQQLDEICGSRPVALVVRDEHAAWVNTEALTRAGITADTPDPFGGRIERDEQGEPTGVLHESAMGLLAGVKPGASVDELDAALESAQALLHSLGITAWQDALVGDFAGIPDVYDAYQRAAREGRLTARVNAALFFDPERGTAQIPELVTRRESATGRFTARTIKIVQDGIPENHTAAMHSPYLDRSGRNTDILGDSLFPPETLRSVAQALDDAGFDMHFHTMGDRALTEVLDALEALQGARDDARHEIAHVQSVRPDDIPRFSELDVTANIQAFWATHGDQMDHVCIPLLGGERADQQFPFADLLHTGARLAAGSDWPVSDPSPMRAIHVAVTRMPPGSDDDTPVFIERQRIPLAEALTAYTAGSAHVNRFDDAGTIELGKVADLVVLASNPFDVLPLDLHAVAPRATFVGGVEVWRAI